MIDTHFFAVRESASDGLRSHAKTNRSQFGVLTEQAGILTIDFFVNILDQEIEWTVSKRCGHFFEGHDRTSGEGKRSGSWSVMRLIS
ncbi:MAG: hypothetical protein CBB69_011565 [Phycisphaera sp. TMED9]|nr:MAG: hypothetical protein CBB69_011565 [Phycisphaera sp. TMED9]